MRVEKICAAAALALSACGDDAGSAASLRIQLSAEETITGGLRAGDGPDDTRDYGVTYTKFLVAIGRLKLARGSHTQSDDRVFIADMRQLGGAGAELFKFDRIATGRWSQFGFETPIVPADAQPLAGVSQADVHVMIDKQLTYWIEGSVDQPGRPVHFSFQVAAPTVYTDCASNGEPGVAVTEGGASTATITLHGDHLWFDALPTASEGSLMRRTAWLVKSDLNGDGNVDASELSNIAAENVFPSALGYNLAGAKIVTALDFVRAQLASQGHLNGEGECVWTPQF